MARPLRIEFPGAFYHVINRGVERRAIFTQPEEYSAFLILLKELHDAYQLKVHSYCLMPNHYHLLVETPTGRLSKIMRKLDGVYTQRFNRRHQRSGPLMQGRYKAILVDKDAYALVLARYIHLNPVKADLVSHPQEWTWSSYPAFLGKRKAESFLDTGWLLSQFSKKISHARAHFQQFTLEGLDSHWEPRREWKASCLLGSEAFCEWVREKFLKNKKNPEIPEIEALGKRSPDTLIRFAQGLSRDPKVQRRMTIYALHRFSSLSLREIADKVGLSSYKSVYQTVYRLKKEAVRNRYAADLLTRIDSSNQS